MPSVKCPKCSAFTPNDPELFQGVPLRIANLSLVQCMACWSYFVGQDGSPVWPLSCPPAPHGVPEKVKEAYEDARLAYAAGAKIGALMAARTALIRFLRDQEAKNFKELVEKQIITPAIYGAVDQLRLWADVAGHDDIELDQFEDQEVEDILNYLATALEQAYTHQARVDEFVRRTRELKNK